MEALARPYPTAALTEEDARAAFVPSAELLAWSHAAFLDPDSPTYNPDHEHLGGETPARILWLWTNVESKRRGKFLGGEASLLQHGQSRWDKARSAAEARRWWDEVAPGTDVTEDAPDFVITLYAPWCAQAGDAEFMALCEHELLHCAQRQNAFGFPCFSQMTGRPLWMIRPHDIEEFGAIALRYGLVSPALRDLARAIKDGPTVAPVNIAAACGTCLAA